LVLTKQEKRRMDSFQNRCLLSILWIFGIPPSFLPRISNAEVLRSGDISASKILERKQLLHLGKILRCIPNHPLRQVSFSPGIQRLHITIWVGRPRKESIPETFSRSHGEHSKFVRCCPELTAAPTDLEPMKLNFCCKEPLSLVIAVFFRASSWCIFWSCPWRAHSWTSSKWCWSLRICPCWEMMPNARVTTRTDRFFPFGESLWNLPRCRSLPFCSSTDRAVC